MSNLLGLGDPKAQFKVYLANRPAFSFAHGQSEIIALQKGEIAAVGQACGNGWRKVFNVYAKLMFALSSELSIGMQANEFSDWQAYREQRLLQQNSNTALMFNDYQAIPADSVVLHIIMGRTYANSLHLPASLQWLDREFAIDHKFKLIVCPYFDYRQLSNIKIIRLVELIVQLQRNKGG
jgi:hypothetical protein